MGEVITLTRDARATAAEMRHANGPDLRFVALHFATSSRSENILSGRDITFLGLPADAVFRWCDKGNWIKTVEGKMFVTEEGVTDYCRRDFAPQSIVPKFIYEGRAYYLEDMAFCVPLYINNNVARAHWLSTGFSHAMLDKFIVRNLQSIVREFAPELMVDTEFSSHAFRHTVNTLLDEGGLRVTQYWMLIRKRPLIEIASPP